MIDAQYLKRVVLDAIRNDVGRLVDDEFARPRHAAGAADRRILSKSRLDHFKKVKGDASGG